jgi:hypothetical protein
LGFKTAFHGVTFFSNISRIQNDIRKKLNVGSVFASVYESSLDDMEKHITEKTKKEIMKYFKPFLSLN